MRKIYIAGKMGEKRLSEATIEKFARAEKQLRSDGWGYVQNPASDSFQECLQDYLSLCKGKHSEEADILLFDLDLLAQCEAVFMLRDWQDSPGATTEHSFAKAIGLKIIYEE